MVRAGVALLVVVSALCAARIEYRAVTDRKLRAKPRLPELGSAGDAIKDPIYGNRILRVTDARTADGYSCATAAAALQNTWNMDATRFVATCSGATYAFRLDQRKFRAKVERERLDFAETPAFGYTDPDLLYGVGENGDAGTNRRVMQYDFGRKKYRTVVDLDRVVPKFPGGAGLVTVSATDRLVVPFGGIQDTFRYVLVFDMKTGRSRLLNTREGIVDGRRTGVRMGFGLHVVLIDKSGRYVILGKGEGQPKDTPNLMVWDTETDRFGDISRGGGHYSAGYGWFVNGDGWWPQWAQWLLRRLDPARLDKFYKLIVPDAPNDYGGREEHSSWSNARLDAWAPVFVTITRHERAKNPLGPWDDEIVALSTDVEHPAVYRLGHHGSVYDGNFWDSPRGNVSPDGRYFMFTSNWGRTLGRSPERQSRQDVFVLELPEQRRVD